MKEAKDRPRPIESIPPECVPYYLLTPRERQVVQHIADGLSNSETAGVMGISISTVEMFKLKIGHIGTANTGISWHEGRFCRTVVLALIQDGVGNGYIHHSLGETRIRPPSPREDEILDAVSQGLTYEEIANDKVISIKTVEAHMKHVNSKLGTRNFFHAVARRTYLMLHGQWEVEFRNKPQLCSGGESNSHILTDTGS